MLLRLHPEMRQTCWTSQPESRRMQRADEHQAPGLRLGAPTARRTQGSSSGKLSAIRRFIGAGFAAKSLDPVVKKQSSHVIPRRRRSVKVDAGEGSRQESDIRH